MSFIPKSNGLISFESKLKSIRESKFLISFEIKISRLRIKTDLFASLLLPDLHTYYYLIASRLFCNGLGIQWGIYNLSVTIVHPYPPQIACFS